MLFTSYSFIFACAMIILLYYLILKKYQWQFLLLVSLLFYWSAAGRGLFLLLLMGAMTYLGALQIGKLTEQKQRCREENNIMQGGTELSRYLTTIKRKQKGCFFFVAVFNVGLLIGLKHILPAIDDAAGRQDYIVPMGISFYTLQALGYLIDVYWEKYEPEKNWGKFALFISFFPQMVQGPIGRYDRLKESLYESHRFDKRRVAFGLQRILWGYFKKLVIADRLLKAVAVLLQNPDFFNGIFVVTGMIFYAVEIYADFTGGIDITIGIAETMGIRIAENFCRPYFAASLKEYWRRWHISLGDWMTEYVFYPLSVSRGILFLARITRNKVGKALGRKIPVYVSTLSVWFLTGLWHGVGWNFILWGLGNGIIILISQESIPLYRRFHNCVNVKSSLAFKCFQCTRTLTIVSILRMLDCYRDLGLAFRMLKSIFTVQNWSAIQNGWLLWIGLDASDYIVIGIGILLMLGVSLCQRRMPVRERIEKFPYWVRFGIWYGLFLVVLLMGAYGPGYEASQFIYYQF